jgi:hypothetical protein
MDRYTRTLKRESLKRFSTSSIYVNQQPLLYVYRSWTEIFSLTEALEPTELLHAKLQRKKRNNNKYIINIFG